MNTMKLTDTISVSGQISPAQVSQIAAAGYQVLINNRPDGEDPGQPDSATIEVAAVAAGLEYHYLPVTAINFPGPDAAKLTDLFDDESQRVLAFCRSGTRSANLWVVTRAESVRKQAADRARQLGYDLGMAARALQP